MSTGFYFTCCCDAKYIYEAWALPVGSQFAVHDLTREPGDPASSSAVFAIDDEYDGDEYGVAMEIGGYVYLAEHDTSDTECSVAKYDSTTGDLEWEHTEAIDYCPLAFRASGQIITSQRMAISDTEAYIANGSTSSPESVLFTSSGTTSYTTSPNSSSNPLSGASANWIPLLLASHDWPTVAGRRSIVQNFTVNSYINTTLISPGLYHHNYNVDYDAVFQVGIGEYFPSTGAMSSVTVIDSQTVSYSGVTRYIEDNSATPPGSATLGQFDDITVGGVLPEFTHPGGPVYPYVFLLNSLGGGSDYVLGYQVRVEDPRSSASYDYIVKVIINGTTVKSWSDSSAFLASAIEGAVVNSPVHSEAIICYFQTSDGVATFEGYDLDGTLNWSELMYAAGKVISVSDTWALVRTPVEVDEELPDARLWDNVSITGSHINWWMVRLDNGEWEPCRQQSSSTSWSNPTVLEGMSSITGDGTNLDLVKNSAHPAGPPVDTYGTTPP